MIESIRDSANTIHDFFDTMEEEDFEDLEVQEEVMSSYDDDNPGPGIILIYNNFFFFPLVPSNRLVIISFSNSAITLPI
jgi:hypothetical protein